MSSAADEDADLVAVFVAERRSADFERLVERHRDSVFRVALSVLGPGRARYAEDVAQDVFVHVYRNVGVGAAFPRGCTASLTTAPSTTGVRSAQISSPMRSRTWPMTARPPIC